MPGLHKTKVTNETIEVQQTGSFRGDLEAIKLEMKKLDQFRPKKPRRYFIEDVTPRNGSLIVSLQIEDRIPGRRSA